MQSELATLWPDKPQEINLEPVKETNIAKEFNAMRGENNLIPSNAMSISKNVLSVVGLGAIVYTGLAIAAPDKLGGNALKGMEPTEQAFLGQVERYCFNRLPALNDNQTCRLWAGKYVQLVSGVDPKLELFEVEVKTQLADGFEEQGIKTTRSKWEAETVKTSGKSKSDQ